MCLGNKIGETLHIPKKRTDQPIESRYIHTSASHALIAEDEKTMRMQD